MAAVIGTLRLPLAADSPRPALRLIPGGHPARPTPAGAGVRLPVVVAVAVLLVLVVAGVLALGRGAFTGLAPAPPSAATASAPAGGSLGGRRVVVRSGDTLWSIARRLQPNGDVRSLVDRLVIANGSSTVWPGDRIAVPR